MSPSPNYRALYQLLRKREPRFLIGNLGRENPHWRLLFDFDRLSFSVNCVNGI